jgi:hypothetical protein
MNDRAQWTVVTNTDSGNKWEEDQQNIDIREAI